ncbi:hypothetical protein HII31_05065 [Pseudocercospora fuligena]|uniref:Uncharacterized protein n=1 Tax=Pseudocercospora fuligena TaxID=685502 RepID=A0A8H6RM94_9PEZI|nr:hypothetical protein HII31_05065 [Pseudocercospora fuligena]
MAAKRDMRRQDLIVPYSEPENKDSNDFQSTMSSTLPMAAIFTRNKYVKCYISTATDPNKDLYQVAWMDLRAIRSPELAGRNKRTESCILLPGLFPGFDGSSVFGRCTFGYMPLFMPPTPGRPATSSGPAAPAP